MQGKRIAVLSLSLVIGIALTAFLIYAHIPLPPFLVDIMKSINFIVIEHIGFGTTAFKFAYSNVLLLVLSFSGIAFIWLDYALGTGFLKS